MKFYFVFLEIQIYLRRKTIAIDATTFGMVLSTKNISKSVDLDNVSKSKNDKEIIMNKEYIRTRILIPFNINIIIFLTILFVLRSCLDSLLMNQDMTKLINPYYLGDVF